MSDLNQRDGDPARPRFVTHSQLRPEFGIKHCQIHLGRLERKGEFPRRIRLKQNSVAWLESEIIAWIEQRVELSRAAA